MVAGSFGVVTLVGRKGDGHHQLEDYRGLGRERPVLALVLSLFLFAQAGVPLTSGFFAKFYVITAAVDAGSTSLAIVAMLAAVIAAFLYLRIVVAMYMTDESTSDAAPKVAIPVGAWLALTVCVVVTIGVGVWPGSISNWAEDAVPVLVAAT
jgi:NADH-quinone oxidoreductase subunit N